MEEKVGETRHDECLFVFAQMCLQTFVAFWGFDDFTYTKLVS